ncbi:bifunctional metallophosphatase/5'-nucleotidase [Nocardia bovistercoris]|uniref:5'-nucleotidase C-terminal domain-containing protein n=1 Tax=Nocardia bovistercoris TaxID=2785916 RepID=A0A931I973_9NOCA|nr:5'-nucleotidase C-terminal domain-containing protein [Nocardia bovistercoris]MBH0776401.1 5'-nucleotidase C-terminal domain-containing protein [Nocardia bovistercoris]
MSERSRITGVIIGLLTLALLTTSCSGRDDDSGSAPVSPPGPVPLVSTNDLTGANPDEIHLFGFNDLHGNLQPPQGSTGKIAGHDAGGAVYLATHMARLKAAYPASAVLAAGDNIGASPLVSGLFHDEPTVTFMNSLGVAASAVGNHEFDDGVIELTRMQQGGCSFEGCSPGAPFTGAAFPYLAANVTDAAGKQPPGLRAWTMLEVGGRKIGVVGTVTPDTVNIVFPEGIRGYSFGDDVAAVNAYVPEMKAAGAQAIVALVHDGGSQRAATPDYNGCENISREVTDLAGRTDPAVRAIVTGHTHQPYVCSIDGKVVTQAASYGRLITDITLRFGADGVKASAVNRVVTREVTPDAPTAALIDFFTTQAAPRAGRVVGAAEATLPQTPLPSGESPLGNVIADAMLTVTAQPASAVAAFMNPGGVRSDLKPGAITFGDIFTVQPFGNQVVTVTLTGQQIMRLLEQQWDNASKPTVLSPAGISYSYTESAPKDRKIVADSVRIGGQPLNPVATYRITTNSFLASGGDGFSVFAEGTDKTVGPMDLDAFESFLNARPPVQAPQPRVEKK